MDIRGPKTLKAALLGLVASLGCVLGTAQSAHATFAFQADGTPGTLVSNAIGFTPGEGNALSVGGITAINNFLAGSGPTTFTELYQSTITDVNTSNGSQPIPGLGSTFQLTVVASVQEVVTSANLATGVATFALAPAASQGASFIQVYQSPGTPANFTLGTGFTAGTMILAGTPLVDPASVSNFENTGMIAPNLDKNDPTAFPGVSTVVGSGQTTIDFNVTGSSLKTAFFPGTPPPSVLALQFISGTNVPFTIEPSTSFAFAGATPHVGTVNGQTGPDFLLQTAGGSLSSLTVVPEPSSLCLTGLGLVGVIAHARRKQKSSV